MAYNATFPQRVPYSTDAQPVRFAPVQDSETGDDTLEPPFVRMRAGNTSFMYVDTSVETQFAGGQNSSQWIVGASSPQTGSHMDARKIKRQALVAVKYMWSTPCVNPTNNIFTFRVSDHPLVNLTAILPTYNYTRLLTGRISPLVSGPPVVVTAMPLTNGYGADVDPEDGIISHLIAAMNAAAASIGSIVTFTAVPSDGYRDLQPSNYNNSQGQFYRIGTTVGTFIFTGGNAFTRGNNLYGNKPIDPVDFSNLANYYQVYQGGPVSYIYTRWFDIVSRTLTQNTKMPLSGTNIPSGLIVRIYMSKEDNSTGTKFIELKHTPVQWLNWIRSQAINTVDIEIRDEFGSLLEIPQRQNNASWFSLILLNEL